MYNHNYRLEVINIKIYIYLDESGSIHKNSRTKYFAVGGYFCFDDDRIKIKSRYKRINYKFKIKKNLGLDEEIKSYDMTQDEKIEIFNSIQNINSFVGIAKIFNKELMKKDIMNCNIFYNYAVKLLINDCILPIINIKDNIEFILSVDNRNVGVGNLKNLENYLSTEFCLNNYLFNVTYYNSKYNYGVQLADLIVNTFYNYYKQKYIVSKVVIVLNPLNFVVSLFPGNKIIGRTKKVSVNLDENVDINNMTC